MTGSPMKRALRAELERRTRAAWPEELERTHLDYVADWQAQGKFLKTLAAELKVSVPYLKEYLRLSFGGSTVSETLSRAREEGAHIHAEEALEIADEADEDNVQVKRLQMQSRQWLTEKWNAREFGSKQGVNVNINVGQLMLTALQAPVPAIEAPSAIVTAIAEPADVLSIEETSTSESE